MNGLTDLIRAFTIAKLQVIMQRALVEIRSLALCKADEQVYDLADAVEFLPSLSLRWNDEQADLARPSLLQYESKYPASAGRYTCILDMEEQEFNQFYLAEHYCWD